MKSWKLSVCLAIMATAATSLVAMALPSAVSSAGTVTEDASLEVAGGNPDGDMLTGNDVAVTRVQQGLVAGYCDRGVYIYKGIPYAKAQRFMPPEPADTWEGVRSSRAYGAVCPQGGRSAWKTDELAFAFDWDDGHQNEDCLTINVWTPGINDNAKRPVMVWMHPGGYTGGSGHEMISFDGTNLALHGDVVVVTFNHRLNELGYLDLSAYGEEYAWSANAGMLDIVAALEWVRDNITSFGGDPGNVTIFGQSGGGGKVATLMAMPQAKGLFHKAIVESGSMVKTMERKYSRMIAAKTLENLGLQPSEVDKLKKMPYKTLHDAGQKAIKQVKPIADADGFNPFIFGWASVVDSLVVPYQLYSPEAMELSKDIPMIVGSVKHEFPTSVYTEGYRNPSDEKALAFLQDLYGSKTDGFIQAYQKAYGECSFKDLIDIDREFRPNVLRHAKARAAVHGGAPVYVYLFDWETPVMDGFLRSIHCLEIPFVFDNVVSHKTLTGGGEEAVTIGRKMSEAWVNFAKTGVPTADELPAWEPYSEEGGATMFFGNDCRIEYNHDKELIDFMLSFPVRGI